MNIKHNDRSNNHWAGLRVFPFLTTNKLCSLFLETTARLKKYTKWWPPPKYVWKDKLIKYTKWLPPQIWKEKLNKFTKWWNDHEIPKNDKNNDKNCRKSQLQPVLDSGWVGEWRQKYLQILTIQNKWCK